MRATWSRRSVRPSRTPTVAPRSRCWLARHRVGCVDALAPGLRLPVCHADVTDVNVVATLNAAGQPWPDALIDFGDLLRTWLAADVAVAGVSADRPRPRRRARVIANVLRGYHSVLPLTEDELAALWPLVVARAASNVASSEHQAQLEPDDEYAVGQDGLADLGGRAVPSPLPRPSRRSRGAPRCRAVGMAIADDLPGPPRPSCAAR